MAVLVDSGSPLISPMWLTKQLCVAVRLLSELTAVLGCDIVLSTACRVSWRG